MPTNGSSVVPEGPVKKLWYGWDVARRLREEEGEVHSIPPPCWQVIRLYRPSEYFMRNGCDGAGAGSGSGGTDEEF